MPRSPSPRSRAKGAPRALPPRLPTLALDALTQEQQALVEAIKSGPRGRGLLVTASRRQLAVLSAQ